jgi:DNA-binding PucR family transcriptional regulator
VPAVREGYVDLVRAALRDRCGVLGPEVPVARAHRSAARAQAAWPVHAAGLLSGEGGLLRTDDHLVELLLAAAPELAADLRERVEEPLRELPAGAAARAVETLRAWLDAHGDVTAAAAALHVHPQTVRYRLASLRETYGDALDSPTGRLELSLGLRALP